jgi:sugar (pentulose or hexulose) kinase
MSAIPVIAIFDIGKTNKKFFLIDESYSIVYEKTTPFNEITDEDGDACDDITLLTQWLKDTLVETLEQSQFEIKALNFSTYGASLVYIDDEGKVICPLYSYLKDYPESLMQGLYDSYGGADKVSCETASPVLGSLNSGMQLYRLMKQKPDLYKRLNYALHLPQYASFVFTHRACSDITSIGCHTQLWDFQKNEYHEWVIEEGLDKKLAPVISSSNTFNTSFGKNTIPVGSGLHDSSAALIPYLAVFTEPFILISTGTWCISLNPFNDTLLTVEELKRDCLCYMGYKGQPVKAARLFAGHEHEQQVKRLADHFHVPAEHYKTTRFDSSMVNSLKERLHFGSIHEAKTGTHPSAFATRKLSDFYTYDEAYHCLLLDIMQQQTASTQLVLKGSPVKRLFVDGGFGNNSIYMHLLCMAFPGLEVYAASVTQATAIGAALAIHKEWNSEDIPADMVKLKYYHFSNTERPQHHK